MPYKFKDEYNNLSKAEYLKPTDTEIDIWESRLRKL